MTGWWGILLTGFCMSNEHLLDCLYDPIKVGLMLGRYCTYLMAWLGFLWTTINIISLDIFLSS